MGWLVVVLGGLLTAVGATVIKFGLDIAARDERGWTTVISGSVGLSGGIVTIALGLLLMRVGAIRRDLKRLIVARSPSAGETSAYQSDRLAEPSEPAVAMSDAWHGEMPHAEAAPATAAYHDHTIAEADPHSRHGQPEAGHATFEDLRHIEGTAPLEEPLGAAVPRHADPHQAFEWHEPSGEAGGSTGTPRAIVQDADPHARIDPAALPPIDHAAEPANRSLVVGQYEANGVAYVMYADGSIEADTPGGLYRFENIAELKSFIENHGAAH